MNEYQRFIALSRYARFDDELGRRETWEETVERLMTFWAERIPEAPIDELREAIVNMDVMPSMRSLMTAGKALERDEVAGYNCSAIAINDPIAFDEALYLLMCGVGVGFSVERQEIAKLPVVGSCPLISLRFTELSQCDLSYQFGGNPDVIHVVDSKYGWASALRLLIAELWAGNYNIEWDLSALRPAGAVLKTFGGRASGPEPLDLLFRYVVKVFRGAAGRKLTSIECHDIMCMIGSVVVSGGVRRSAMISLSNLSDDRMRHAKSGEWWNTNPERAYANNSVAYTEKPDIGVFMREWISLYESKSGERGLFNREGAKAACQAIGRDIHHEFMTNPCGEVILRSRGLCNLSEVVVRPDDTFETLKEKVRIATILGTMQSTLTDFVYLSPKWRENAEDERLLGVSMTGIQDNPGVSYSGVLFALRAVARSTNRTWAHILGIRPAAAITCVKPSGNVSQLVDASSGLHARYAPYYIRRVRADMKDPLAKVMKAQGFPCETDVVSGNDKLVFSFPMKAPEGSVFQGEVNALEQLEHWLLWKEHWCDHNPSVTITVRDHEWMEVGAWVYAHFDQICGLSFLPHSDHVYRQAPYEEISADQYRAMLSTIPAGIDFGALADIEREDHTTGAQELACVSGMCEI